MCNDTKILLSKCKLAFNHVQFLDYEIIGAPKKFKNQPRPLFRPRSVILVKIF
jgi:hypothetical protein